MKSPIDVSNVIPLNNPLTFYHCGYEQCTPSHSFGPAIRPHYLFHYILSGNGTYYVNGGSYPLTKGNGFLITPGVSTLYQADEKEPWEYCWIGFDGYDVITILQNCGFTTKNLIFSDSSQGKLKDNLINLIHSFKEGLGNEYSYLGQLYLCLSYMSVTTNSINRVYNETYLEKALEYIHHNYTYDIKITDISKYIGIDRTYLYKLFIGSKKISPQQYLINFRLSMAEKLLKETQLSVTEIAYSCGFKDAPSFYKHFKKHLQITPLQYRANEMFIM